MQTRRDHIHAYQFSVGRLVQAVAAGDPGTGEQPLRRGNLGVVFGAVIAVLLSGGAVVYGLISPPADTSWKSQGSIIVEKETGTRYVLLNGMLRPTANYTSALLVAGAAKPTVHMVKHKALAAFPIGTEVGIAGAPDTLPAAKAMLDGTWSLCLGTHTAQNAGDGSDTGSEAGPDTVLDLVPGGRTTPVPERPVLVVEAAAPARNAAAATGGSTSPSSSVSTPASAKASGATADAGAGREFVFWDAKKYPVPNTSVLAALGLGATAPVPAPASWLGLFPSGDPLSPASVPSAHQTGPAIAGHPARVGQLFQTTAAGVQQFYVLRTDGLAPITRTEAALFETAPGVAQPTNVDPSAIAAAPVSADQSLLRRLPDLMAQTPFSADSARLCAYQAKAGSAAAPALVTEPAAAFPDGVPVLIPAGRGLIAQSTSVDPATGQPAVILISDRGKRFTLGSGAYQSLGFTGVAGHVFPDAVLALVPAGPGLSSDAAKRSVS